MSDLLPLFNVVTLLKDTKHTSTQAAPDQHVAIEQAKTSHISAYQDANEVELAPGICVLVFEVKRVGTLDLTPR
jgi:hypothetical protein